MKKIALVFICYNIMTGSFAQTLFSFGKNTVSKGEFIRAFNKNPNLPGDRKTALKEYLNLYVNFKLKVQAAYDAGLDKDPTQQYELQNFRRQLAENIINEEANVKVLVQEAFDRSHKEIHVAQVIVEVLPNADTVSAYQRIQAAYKALKEGKVFEAVTTEYSSDEATRQSKGDLGYITAFTLPYNIENIIYGLKPNVYSNPVRTKIGYHIFKNLGERPSLGSRRVAQIMVAYPPNGSVEDQSAAALRADSLYNLLQQGVAFENLAATASNDLSSSNNKGELPEFTTGTYTPDFETVAFALPSAGAVSKPFKTAYGYHILKLIEAKPAPTDLSDATTFAVLQDKVNKAGRLENAKKEFIQKKLALIKYKPAILNHNNLYQFTDSALIKAKPATLKGITENTLLFSFARQNVKAGEWLKFVRAVKSSPGQYPDNTYPALFKEFVRVSAEEYYRDNLELYNPDFARQVTEFKEANLLFGVMEKNVWGRANDDTAGLEKYYKEQKEKYLWEHSADAIIVTCNNQKLADELQEKLKGDAAKWRQIIANAGNDILADSGRFELNQLPVIDRTNFTSGLLTAPVKNENDGTFTFNYVINVYDKQGQRSFEDARGLVISDYQQVLEDKWIMELKKKYPVKVNYTVFNSIK